MNNISIVTAFYDIGRGSWTPDTGLPGYLHRSTDTYMERFARLAKLNNDITIFTSKDLEPRVSNICANRAPGTTNIVVTDIFKEFKELHQLIASVQKRPEFLNNINSQQRLNPEYWNAEYNLVTNLKPWFVNEAIDRGLTQHPMVAWIDFGYCRTDDRIPQSKIWEYNFNPEKIHFFMAKNYDDAPIKQIMANNDVYVWGNKIVAHQTLWPELEDLMFDSIYGLLRESFTDDDQGHLLHALIMRPDLFEQHLIREQGDQLFVLFQQYNDRAD